MDQKIYYPHEAKMLIMVGISYILHSAMPLCLLSLVPPKIPLSLTFYSIIVIVELGMYKTNS